MRNIILLQSYVGRSTGYIFSARSNGRYLSIEEVKKLGLVDEDTLRRNKGSDWTCVWYEVNPGDRIEVIFFDENTGIDVDSTFLVPEQGLEDPPQKIEIGGRHPSELYDYLLEHCEEQN